MSRATCATTLLALLCLLGMQPAVATSGTDADPGTAGGDLGVVCDDPGWADAAFCAGPSDQEPTTAGRDGAGPLRASRIDCARRGHPEAQTDDTAPFALSGDWGSIEGDATSLELDLNDGWTVEICTQYGRLPAQMETYDADATLTPRGTTGGFIEVAWHNAVAPLCVTGDPCEDVALTLASMCQVGDEQVWRVTNPGDQPVDFEVVDDADKRGTAEPDAPTYFSGTATTTTIAWGGLDTPWTADRATATASGEPCVYEVTLVTAWLDGDAPQGGPFVTATSGDQDAITEAGGALAVTPGGTYTVTEDAPDGWQAVTGLGEFTTPEWAGPEAFFDTSPPNAAAAADAADAATSLTHMVVHEPIEVVAPSPTVAPTEAAATSAPTTSPAGPGDPVEAAPPVVDGASQPSTSGTTLPHTGTETAALVALAIAMVAFGGTALAWSRRTSRRD